MKCCKKELPNPEIVDGTAYFICPECGDVREVEDYKIYTVEDALVYFKEKYGFVLPTGYLALSISEETKVVTLPPIKSEKLKYLFGERFYEIGTVASVDPNAEYSIHKCISNGLEWGLPDTYVPIEGDGHRWLVLDYGDSLTEPKVRIAETDEGCSLVLAKSFDEFVSRLLPYKDAYDSDGNVIFTE